MTKLVYNHDKFFVFTDTPITKCFLDNQFLHIECEFVYCFFNNSGRLAVYSSEGHPKIVIQLKKIINWSNWENQENYTNEFKQHISSLIGTELLKFSYKDNIGKIIYVSPENLYFYRDVTKEEIQQFLPFELPKIQRPASFH
ncbi:hypothetical protein GM58_00580 [Listeria monocytogenes]|nr:hypothetical protein [Listeria monocytogenes]EAE1795590.1 hypothetical protein [Listeria monocytogenes]EAH4336793.1 hypothetical protein [Listeria monocytogenes]ECH7051956.1 hypothetical protein [Listeria monocytogenes]EIZ6617276.1 hypothetical protein [Listeria monocytogenes]